MSNSNLNIPKLPGLVIDKFNHPVALLSNSGSAQSSGSFEPKMIRDSQASLRESRNLQIPSQIVDESSIGNPSIINV